MFEIIEKIKNKEVKNYLLVRVNCKLYRCSKMKEASIEDFKKTGLPKNVAENLYDALKN